MGFGILAKGLLLACTGAEAVATGARGIVHVSPVHPGPQRVGESASKPMIGAAVQVLDADRRVVARLVTDANGRFSASLRAGEYWFEVDTGGAALPRCGDANAVVRDGHMAEIEIDCDSGMR